MNLLNKCISLVLTLFIFSSCALVKSKYSVFSSTRGSNKRVVFRSQEFYRNHKKIAHFVIQSNDSIFIAKRTIPFKMLILEQKDGYLPQTYVFSRKNVKGHQIILPPLIPFVYKKPDQNYIIIDSLRFKTNPNNIMIVNYWNSTRLSEQRKGKKTNPKLSLSNAFIFDNSSSFKTGELENLMTEHLNRNNINNGFQDTSHGIFAANNNANKLKILINEVYISYKLKYGVIVNINAQFSLMPVFENGNTVTKSIVSKSILMPHIYAKTNHEVFFNAIDVCLNEFLAMDDVQAALTSDTQVQNNIMSEWEEILIDVHGNYCENPKEAVLSVVTVLNDDSHGSGCIISNDGYIITNHHIISGNKNGLYIIMSNKNTARCELIRSNQTLDIALLKMEPVNVKPLKLAETNEIIVGSDVFAIGAPGSVELGQSVSKGIISGKRKIHGSIVIQTDVSISPGSSGGALLYSDGTLAGIISSKIIEAGYEGIGFAIPAYIIIQGLKIKIKQ